MKRSCGVKEKIIKTTIDIMSKSSGDVADINTRAIAEKANVGIGLINYHFQTKENLIEICVERIIGNVISSFKPHFPSTLETPIEQLKYSTKMVCDFLINNPAISRISILSDYKNPQKTDNTMQSAMEMKSVIDNLKTSEKEKKILVFAFISAMQALFLRKDQSYELFGYDMSIKEHRDEVLDILIDSLFKGLERE